MSDIDNRRAIIDRRALAERMSDEDAAALLAEALADGRVEIARRLAEQPGAGRAAAQATSFLHDQIVRLAYDQSGAPLGPGLALVALGGTGRGEMAPFSDLDLMFLTASAPTAGQQKAAEAILHLLWDLKLKVGHSIRSVDQLIALARSDMSVRTAFLEARLLWGDDRLLGHAEQRFRKEILSGSAAQFVAAKLAERDARHVRMGDSRYVVEPNVKDG